MSKIHPRYANIEAERVRNGLSKGELSSQLDITTKTYRNWQVNGSDIPASKLLAMSQLFKCSIDYLLETT